jgi:hypothetical protein
MTYFENITDSTITTSLTILTIIIISIAFYYLFYYYGTLFTPGLLVKECNNMETLYGKINGRISSIDPSLDKFKYKLKDYYIQTAYNACSGGNYKNAYVDVCILKNLLRQGVRGLDFEIFSVDDKPVVATSTTDNYHYKETFNYVDFTDVMNIIRDYAFGGSTSPNPNDPLLIHIRFKSNNTKMFNNFAKLLENYNTILLDKKYSYGYYGKNLGDVSLEQLMGKVIIIVDKNNNSFLESQEFYEYVNMTSNSIFMRAIRYNNINNSDINELVQFNKLGMTICMPNNTEKPINPNSEVMRQAGCQLLAMCYQENDVNLQENIHFFNSYGYSFVLKPVILTAYTNKNELYEGQSITNYKFVRPQLTNTSTTNKSIWDVLQTDIPTIDTRMFLYPSAQETDMSENMWYSSFWSPSAQETDMSDNEMQSSWYSSYWSPSAKEETDMSDNEMESSWYSSYWSPSAQETDMSENMWYSSFWSPSAEEETDISEMSWFSNFNPYSYLRPAELNNSIMHICVGENCTYDPNRRMLTGGKIEILPSIPENINVMRSLNFDSSYANLLYLEPGFSCKFSPHSLELNQKVIDNPNNYKNSPSIDELKPKINTGEYPVNGRGPWKVGDRHRPFKLPKTYKCEKIEEIEEEYEQENGIFSFWTPSAEEELIM